MYFFKKYNSAKYNYEIYDKELITIIYAFEEQRLKLEDLIESIKIITNYKNLEYFIFIK